MDGGVYAYTLPDPSTLSFPGELKGMFGRIAFIAPNGELIPWQGSSMAIIGTPRYVDAVTLGGIDYIYVMDRAAGRVMEVTRQGNSGHTAGTSSRSTPSTTLPVSHCGTPQSSRTRSLSIAGS